MTAIIVAAIPFPDAAAADPVSQSSTAIPDYSTEVIPKYPTEQTGGDYISITDSTNGFDLSLEYKSSNDSSIINNILPAHTISDEGGAWELDWQYKYYKNANGVCLITEYNDLYPKDTIKLDANVYSNYINIPQAEYVKILSDADTVDVQLYAGDDPIGNTIKVETLGKKYTLEGNPYKIESEGGCKESEGYNFIRDYFSEDFNKYLADYDQYLANVKNDPTGFYTEPLSVTKTNGDRYDDTLQYVCDKILVLALLICH